MKKLLALVLVLVTVLSLFAGCGGNSDEIVLPTVKVEDSLENRQQAGVEIAKALWRKNPYMQYDNTSLTPLGSKMGWRAHFDWETTPEHASEQNIMYSVCSSFGYDTAFQSVEYSIMGSRPACLTKDLSLCKGVEDEMIVFQRINDPDDMATNKAEAAKAEPLMQPGDIITYFRYNGSGHTVVYCGDLNGDGAGDILHSDGKAYDHTNGVDRTEADGTVKFNLDTKYPSAHVFLFDEVSSEYLAKADRYSIVRPANLDPKEYPLTEPAKTRVAFPDMAIFYTCSAGYHGAVNADGQLTYTLRIENHGTKEYEGLILQIPVPKNAKIVAVNGAPAKNGTLKFSATVPAGGNVTMTYTVEPTAGIGSEIVAEGGYVHTLPLPTITTGVQKASFDKEAVKAAIAAAAGKEGADFVNAVWKALDPATPAIPEFKELVDALYSRKNVGELKAYQAKPAEEITDKTLSDMVVHEYFGGRSVVTPGHNHRILTLRYCDLQPGDVLVYGENSMLEHAYGIFDGDFMILAEDGKNRTLLETQYGNFLSKDFFTVLRPTEGAK